MTSFDNGMPDTVRGIGERLRQARIRAGLTPADAAGALKIPAHMIEALEREDWAKLGAPVFVRGHLKSYSRLLGLPADAIVESSAIPSAKVTEIVPRTFTPRVQRVAEQTGRRLVYVLITAAIAVPVWLATRAHLDAPTAQTVPLDAAPAPLPQVSGETATPDAAQPPASAGVAEPAAATPLVASMAPMPQQAAEAGPGDLSVRFNGESWVKLTGPDGAVVEQALVPSGQQRIYKPGQLAHAVLGNAQAIAVTYRGQPVDLAPYIRANVVRFTVSSDGSLQPVER